MDPLQKIWDLLLSTLIERLESGECTTQDLNIARQLLKDHGINVDKPEETQLASLNQILPFSQADEPPHEAAEQAS